MDPPPVDCVLTRHRYTMCDVCQRVGVRDVRKGDVNERKPYLTGLKTGLEVFPTTLAHLPGGMLGRPASSLTSSSTVGFPKMRSRSAV